MSVLRNNSKARKDRAGIWLFVALGVLTLAGGAYIGYDAVNRVNFDDLGCPDSGPPSKLVFLIDTSDQISPLQKLELRKRIDGHIRTAPAYSRVAIYSLVPDEKTHVRKVFDRCKPRDGTAANALTENERLLKKEWTDKFAEPVGVIINDALGPQNSTESPILEALQYVAVAEENDDPGQFQDLELIIGSDMLQNTAEYSHYRDAQEYSLYEAAPYSVKTALSIPSWTVRLLYIARPGYEALQSRKHVLFWEQFFMGAGAMVQSVNVLAAGG